jgi:type 1 glutamine amidotransferase
MEKDIDMNKGLARATWAGLLLCALASTTASAGENKIRVLIIDGQNNHDWKSTTPFMKKALESCGRFKVDVATTPQKPKPALPPEPKGASEDELARYKQDLLRYADAYAAYRRLWEKFQPDLSRYDVVLSNYNGAPWPKGVEKALEAELKSGKIGLVIVHAANNSFGGWKEYNQMIGMGWRGAKGGDRLLFDNDGKEIRVLSGQGDGSGHRYSGQFTVTLRDREHPITKGMPDEWLHNNDELYDNMRGPIQNVHVLATAYSKGTKAHEPMIWTVSYGQGRVFHTPMGHDVNAMRCVGFIATLQRGTEWAATGNVTLPLPEHFPTAKKTSTVPAK